MKATEQATDNHQQGKCEQAIPTGRPAAPDEQPSSRRQQAIIHHAVPTPPRTRAETLNNAIPPLFHDAGNSDLLKHTEKKKRKPICLNPETIKTAPLRHPNPAQATKPVSAQGPRSGKAAVAQSGQQGGGIREEEGEGVPPRRTPGRNASSHFISAHCSKSPESAGSLRAWAAGGGEGVGRRTAR